MASANVIEVNPQIEFYNVPSEVRLAQVHQIGIERARKSLIARGMSPSVYTVQGKKKCVAGEPFRTQEDILRAREFLAKNTNKKIALRNVAILTLGISIGIRGNDLLRLQIRDIQRPDGSIVDELMVQESKTSKMNHPIVNDEAKKAILEYLTVRGNYKPTDYLFHSHKGEHLTTDGLYFIMHDIEKELGLNYRLTIRSLRKTFAYWTIKMHQDDVNVMACLQEMLNHSDMKTTLHYSGHAKDHLDVMYNDMSNVFNISKKLDIKDNPKLESKLDKILAMLMEDEE